MSLLHTQHASVQPAEIFQRKMDKHVRELAKICSTGRSEAIAMVEVLLAIMRLCCEKFFVLATVFAAYLLYRDDVPFYARIIARTNHHLSSFYQKVSNYMSHMRLYSPASPICVALQCWNFPLISQTGSVPASHKRVSACCDI